MQWQPLDLNATCPAHTHLTACSSVGFLYLQLLVQLFGDSVDRRIQESHGRETQDTRHEEFDFIVVGAGSAGCVVANRLSAFPKWKVLLLEAGPEQPDVTLVPALSETLLGSNIDWGYKTEPNGKSCLARPGQQCDWPRGKTMGGSSSINTLVYIRGNKLDYDEWAAMGNEGWSYRDVLPYFKKSEKNLNMESLNRKYHGVDGEQSVSRYPYVDAPSVMMTDAFNERGLPLTDYNGVNQLGTMQAQAVAQDGERVSTNNAFIQPIRYRRKNLTVKVNSEVLKILIDEHRRAYGVVYKQHGRLYTAVASKEVIVSAGSLNSPKLLMLSGVGPKEHLHELNIDVISDLAVGENLHDHVTFNGIIIALPNETATAVDDNQLFNEIKLYKQMDVKHGPLSASGPLSTIAFYKTDPSLPAPDIQFQMAGVKYMEYFKELVAYEGVNIFPTAFYDAILPQTMNLVPKSRGKLLLNATNPHGDPLIFANYFEDPTDIMPIVKGTRFLISLEDTHAFKSKGAYFVKKPLEACRDYDWGSDEYIICLNRAYTRSTYHPVGTCKMGPQWDRKAVVDPRLRVYGVAGLRVMDSSIMPVVPRGNTNAPSIMIGERGVDLVIEEWRETTTKLVKYLV
ncbi:glucose dehydrogenase [FAD, quinone]-like [Manduca sexta]|uniref:glucose dehydrogenase [FAD, quinone]-like n=1 Tax=Manduca sexta TaxID=7130 RepID=UPI00188EFE09|nr:glucose dehydrogenase [FAD, quinone]-like [Manduca sexta]